VAESSNFHADIGDHLHEIGLGEEDDNHARHPERIVHFDYNKVARGLGEEEESDKADIADVASALKSIVM
jgi:hypothetical protein